MVKEVDFDEIHIGVLEAAIDRLIPPDDYPGAKDSGTGVFIIQLLRGDEQHLQSLYREGLRALNEEARIGYGNNFADISLEQQDAVLRQIEKSAVQTQWSVDPKVFFDTLLRHTTEGFYSDAANGGNRDSISWKMIGF